MNNISLPLDKLCENLKSQVPPLLKKNNIPGLALCMFKGDKIILNLEFGVKNSQTKEPIDARTVFEGASFTKPMIGYAALKLCQQGLLSLDKPLRSYLVAPYKGDPPLLEKVTLRHILSHYSGFPEYMLGPLEPLMFAFYPGSKYGYSNSGFNYLAHVIENLIEMPIADYLKQTILIPLQMNDSSFIWEPRYESQAATPHNRKGEPVEKWKPKKVVGACSLHTTPTDFAKFMISIIHQAKQSSNEQAINMLDEQVSAEKGIFTSLGWGIEKTVQGDVFYHAGNTVTFKSMAAAFREQELGVVFMTNSISGYHIFENMLALTLGGNHKAISDIEEFDKEDLVIDAIGENYLVNWWYAYSI
ncbi:MAG: beta-lactamase family protein [Proteobacteria bacterium]|nr:beta-lactamase family protein [Pseudomonadota bacterium]